MEYNSETDIYICRNNKKLTVDFIRHVKNRTGYISEKTIYKYENCAVHTKMDASRKIIGKYL